MLAAPRLVVATGNAHKVTEIDRILTAAGGIPGWSGDVVSAATAGANTDVAETEVTFEGNALLKASTVAAATGEPALADDSGLAVDVLGGSPGIFSARWAGVQASDVANRELLMQQLADVPEPHRAARFVCVVAIVAGQESLVVRGECPGQIATTASGDGGFGYDPVFVPAGHSCTMAELTGAEKDDISHRGAALAGLIEQLSAPVDHQN